MFKPNWNYNPRRFNSSQRQPQLTANSAALPSSRLAHRGRPTEPAAYRHVVSPAELLPRRRESLSPPFTGAGRITPSATHARSPVMATASSAIQPSRAQALLEHTPRASLPTERHRASPVIMWSHRRRTPKRHDLSPGSSWSRCVRQRTRELAVFQGIPHRAAGGRKKRILRAMGRFRDQ